MRYAQAPPTKAANAVYVTLAAQVLALGSLVIFEQVRGRQLAAQLAEFGGRPSGADAEALVGAATTFAVLLLLTLATTVAAAAAHTTWLVRVRRRVAPATARSAVAAAWLIPGVNLIAPAVLVYETWQAAGPPEEGRRSRMALVTGWWLSLLTTLTVFTVVPSFDAGGLTGLGVLELTCLTLSAGLCAATVRRITALRSSPASRAAKPSVSVARATRLDPAA
ncbi:DUF4328 domain-containing protein [Nonomuraea sp. NPDC048826]|uniref:DUF4328 domain-containing protein n=1 Tax=Nonomuraea sp. NPDC048826 TaxID=3364347 RepID=UPI00371E0D57